MDKHNNTIHKLKKSLVLAKKLISCVPPVDNLFRIMLLNLNVDQGCFD